MWPLTWEQASTSGGRKNIKNSAVYYKDASLLENIGKVFV